jgi:hypothetical protein
MLSLPRDSGEGVQVESNHRYFLRRAEEESRRARLALTQAAKERHRELADLFAAKAAKTLRIQELQLVQP